MAQDFITTVIAMAGPTSSLPPRFWWYALDGGRSRKWPNPKLRTQASAQLLLHGVNSAFLQPVDSFAVVLQTEGKAIPGVQSLWRISVGALCIPVLIHHGIHLDLTPSWDYNWQSPIVPVSPTSITVTGNHPQATATQHPTLLRIRRLHSTLQVPTPV